jgi:hypothetical protein
MKRTWQTAILGSLLILLASCGTPTAQLPQVVEVTNTDTLLTAIMRAPTGPPSSPTDEPTASSTPLPTAEDPAPTSTPLPRTVAPPSTNTPPPTAAPSLPSSTLTPSSTPFAIFLADDIQRLTPADAKTLFDSGRALLYDVRSTDQYRAMHAAGSLSFPEARMAARFGELPTGKSLIFY